VSVAGKTLKASAGHVATKTWEVDNYNSVMGGGIIARVSGPKGRWVGPDTQARGTRAFR